MQLTIDYVLTEWSTDSVIDELKLDSASLGAAKLHGKYLRLHSMVKVMLKKEELKMDRLKKDKRLHFERKLPRGKIDQYGWEPDPFDGLIVLKCDMDSWSRADPDVQKQEDIIEQLKITRDALKEIMESIKYRTSAIKNAIQWRLFMEGG